MPVGGGGAPGGGSVVDAQPWRVLVCVCACVRLMGRQGVGSAAAGAYKAACAVFLLDTAHLLWQGTEHREVQLLAAGRNTTHMQLQTMQKDKAPTCFAEA